ncbi:unnamed protein product, partial [Mesorhabditis spiculigera]
MDSDRLSPRQSGKFIAERAEHIKFDEAAVQKVAAMILDAATNGELTQVQFAAQDVHPRGGGVAAIEWVFLLDTINFSFWPDEGSAWEITWKGTKQTGYFGACAAVNIAMENGVPMTSAKWMSEVTAAELGPILRSSIEPYNDIPLLAERVKAVNESGKILLEKFDGSFYNVVNQADGSCKRLLELIVENFPSFRDFAEYKGQKVSLLKRAQILVMDVYGALEGQLDGKFGDLSELTMFADYRVPQVMAYLGIFDYSEGLLEKLKNKVLLPNGSPEEVEIRGCSIAGCDRIYEAVQQLAEKCGQEHQKVTAGDIDVFLWMFRRKHAVEIEPRVPMHRTRCIYY